MTPTGVMEAGDAPSQVEAHPSSHYNTDAHHGSEALSWDM